MAKTITIGETPTSYSPTPRIDFTKSEYEKAIWDNGYEVISEKAMRCSCKSREGGENLPSCKNCGGSGWFWINPKQTRMLLEQQTLKAQYQAWGFERPGHVSITALPTEQLGFMDRITVTDARSYHSEVTFLDFSNSDNKKTGRLVYAPIDVSAIFLFEGSSVPMVKLEAAQYSLVGNLLSIEDVDLNKLETLALSIRYSFSPAYHVIKENRTNMVTRTLSDKPSMPVNVTGELAHYTFDQQNAYYNESTETYLFDNSFTQLDC